MNKKILPLFIFLISILLSPFKSYAQTESVYIENFNSDVIVNLDGTVEITEVITYIFNTGNTIEKHGMFREIPLSYELDDGSRQHIDIHLLGVEYKTSGSDLIFKQYTTTKDSDTFNIKIGDPNTVIQGRWIYTIKYRVNYLIQNYTNLDKLYLNILGETWQDPIYSVTATVTMPAKIEESYCYTGEKGSTESNCFIKNLSDNKIEITSNKVFRKGEFLTVTATVAPNTIAKLDTEKENFNKNFSSTITQTPKVNNEFPINNKFTALLIIVPFFLIILSIIAISTKVRENPSRSGIIKITKYLPNTIPQYNIPSGWYILKISTFMKYPTTGPIITAQIVQLCVYGYLKIRREGNKIYLDKTSKSIDTLVKPLKNFYEGLMQNKQSIVINKGEKFRYSTRQFDEEKLIYSGILRSNISIATSETYRELRSEDYFKEEEGKSSVFIVVVAIAIALMFISFLVASITNNPVILFYIFSIISSIIFIYIIFINFKTIKPDSGYTTKGVEMLKQIHGLHMYMKTAEEQRIQFHNDPQKYKGVFESLLPYAILFGMEKKWSKLFNISTLTWYAGDSMSDFGSISSSISSFASSNIVVYSSSGRSSSGGSSSSSSGSSGGSSGGGGGGGGGGSW